MALVERGVQLEFEPVHRAIVERHVVIHLLEAVDRAAARPQREFELDIDATLQKINHNAEVLQRLVRSVA